MFEAMPFEHMHSSTQEYPLTSSLLVLCLQVHPPAHPATPCAPRPANWGLMMPCPSLPLPTIASWSHRMVMMQRSPPSIWNWEIGWCAVTAWQRRWWECDWSLRLGCQKISESVCCSVMIQQCRLHPSWCWEDCRTQGLTTIDDRNLTVLRTVRKCWWVSRHVLGDMFSSSTVPSWSPNK